MKECFMVFCSLTMFAWTWLRETPSFWREEGGDSLLRGLTLDLYLPCLGLLSVGLLLAFENAWRKRSWPRFVTLNFAGAILLACVCLMGANNLSNLVEGRPLHWHPGDQLFLKV